MVIVYYCMFKVNVIFKLSYAKHRVFCKVISVKTVVINSFFVTQQAHFTAVISDSLHEPSTRFIKENSHSLSIWFPSINVFLQCK